MRNCGNLSEAGLSEAVNNQQQSIRCSSKHSEMALTGQSAMPRYAQRIAYRKSHVRAVATHVTVAQSILGHSQGAHPDIVSQREVTVAWWIHELKRKKRACLCKFCGVSFSCTLAAYCEAKYQQCSSLVGACQADAAQSYRPKIISIPYHALPLVFEPKMVVCRIDGPRSARHCDIQTSKILLTQVSFHLSAHLTNISITWSVPMHFCRRTSTSTTHQRTRFSSSIQRQRLGKVIDYSPTHCFRLWLCSSDSC